MTRHALPRPLGERWLEAAGPGLAPSDLADRLAFWRARESSFRAHARFDLEGPGARPTPEARVLCETFLPLAPIARDVHALLRARFGPALRALDPEWEHDALARAGTWLDARRELASLAHEALPSRLLERLAADQDDAEAFAFELHDPVSYGHGLARYPDALARIAKLAPPRTRAWDAGCGTGEGTISLARTLACRSCARESVEVIGTTPSPWELLMARRLGRPHDLARTQETRAAAAKLDENPAIRVRFEGGDLLRAQDSPRNCDIVLVGGVLGGVLSDQRSVLAALRSIAAALTPTGRAFVVNRFRADRASRARELIADLAPLAGLELITPDELRLYLTGTPSVFR